MTPVVAMPFYGGPKDGARIRVPLEGGLLPAVVMFAEPLPAGRVLTSLAARLARVEHVYEWCHRAKTYRYVGQRKAGSHAGRG